MPDSDKSTLKILNDFKAGRYTVEETAGLLAGPATDNRLTQADIEQTDDEESSATDAILDISREARVGFPEAIYGASKSPKQICEIFCRLFATTGKALATRCSQAALELLKKECPAAELNFDCGMAWAISEITLRPWAKIAILAAGTSDITVAEEAALTLEFMGFTPERIYDVGVAGIHRLMNRLDLFRDADVVIVTAGMEGALPSVVGGLVGCPVIAVPTSVGYGASFNGIAALLGMLNSCAAGITVVNIDNGFGAAAAAVRILREKK